MKFSALWKESNDLGKIFDPSPFLYIIKRWSSATHSTNRSQLENFSNLRVPSSGLHSVFKNTGLSSLSSLGSCRGNPSAMFSSSLCCSLQPATISNVFWKYSSGTTVPSSAGLRWVGPNFHRSGC